MGQVVNLRTFRKQRARADKAAKAAENRRKHGRTRAEVEADARDREKSAAFLDSTRLDDDKT